MYILYSNWSTFHSWVLTSHSCCRHHQHHCWGGSFTLLLPATTSPLSCKPCRQCETVLLPMQGWVCLTQKGFCCILLMELCFMIASFSYFSAISKYYLCFVIYNFHICKQCCNLCCHTILWVADVQKYTAAIFKVPRVMVHIHCVTSGGPVRRLWNFSSFTLWYVLLAVICSGTLFVVHILTHCSG